jgi:uracil-DNA glycosylase
VAAQALLGRDVRVTRDRGRIFESELAPVSIATIHPSSILRARDSEERRREHARLVEDLRRAAEVVETGG